MIPQVRHPQRMAAALGLGALLAAAGAQATTLNPINLLSTQSEFRLLTEDLGAASSYRMLAPATPLGLTGFDVSVGSTFTTLANRDVWRKAAAGASVPSMVPVPALRIAKGLPGGFDLGATYSTVPNSGASLVGAEVRYAIVEGGPLTPAVGVRLSATRLNGVKQVGLSNTGIDVAISKGLPIVTPYGGVGLVRTSASPEGTKFKSETANMTRVFAGAHFNLVLFDFTLEADRVGKATSASARLGFRF